MELSISIPALFFPAISLTMLAYNARYLAISGLIRNLNKEYKTSKEKVVYRQIAVLNKRMRLIIATQGFAIISFIGCIITMLFIYLKMSTMANVFFMLSLLCMVCSLVILFIEILVSMNALKILLDDMSDE